MDVRNLLDNYIAWGWLVQFQLPRPHHVQCKISRCFEASKTRSFRNQVPLQPALPNLATRHFQLHSSTLAAEKSHFATHSWPFPLSFTPPIMALKCVHQGCGKTYSDEDEVCVYHPGPPIFHEGQKGTFLILLS